MSKSFKDREWTGIVFSRTDPDVAESNFREFYYPAFERTKTYRRIAGYFSSSSLAYLCEGITELIENNGKMLLITSSSITQQDKEAMERGIHSKEYYLTKPWDSLLIESENDIELKDNFEALAWLLANDRLEIKIGFNLEEETILSNEESKFHEKIALFEDYEGNFIFSIGSTNETGPGYCKNRDAVAVQEGWKDEVTTGELLLEFNTLWEEEGDKCSIVYKLPKALEEKLLEIAPKEISPRFKRKRIGGAHSTSVTSSNKLKREIRDYQQNAIDEWIENKYRGILNMATGTGKTFTALNAIKQCCSVDSGILLIVAPQIEIAKQWKSDCLDVFGVDVSILMCNGSNTTWKNDIKSRLQSSLVEFEILIAVNGTFSRDFFFEQIYPYQKRITLIVDEVHEIGAQKAREKLVLLDKISKRLGLSATPERMRDDEGNAALGDYFGGEIYQYSMHDAIYPPSGDLTRRFLCPYDYFVHYSSLTDSELEKYHEVTEEISKYYTPEDKKETARYKKYNSLCMKRAQVIKGSDDRLRVLKEILFEYDPDLNLGISETYTKCIIYCNTVKESERIYQLLHSLNLTAAQYHNDINGRNSILETYTKSTFIRYLISIACLDQGVDIPICDGAIILSSTGNRRQYIQRRGRVLRTNNGRKLKAYIHDVVVLPYDYSDIVSDTEYLDDVESSLVYRQINRVETFVDDSDNKILNEKKLLELKRNL